MSSPNDPSPKAKCDQNQNPLVEDYQSSDDESYENIEKPSSTSRNFGESILASNQQFKDSIHSLNMWIWQCQTWTYFHGVLQTRLNQQQQLQLNNQNFHDQQQRRFLPSNNGIIMKLPTIKKRLLASFIDYFFVHFIYDQFRMLVTEVWDYDLPFNSMDFRELETFFPEDDDGLEDLLSKVFWIYVKTIQYAALFYLFYLIYETMFLYGFPNRGYPGSTIGKRILGLRVISCNHLEQISLADNFLVRVQPGGNLTFFKAFLRTLVKLMPISNTIQCINILTSRFNRSYFDKKMGCLVVDVSAQAAESIAQAVAAASRFNNNNNNNTNNNNNRHNQNNLNNQGVNNHNQLQQPQHQQQQRPALNRVFW